jgi:hypothetical protein
MEVVRFSAFLVVILALQVPSALCRLMTALHESNHTFPGVAAAINMRCLSFIQLYKF